MIANLALWAAELVLLKTIKPAELDPVHRAALILVAGAHAEAMLREASVPTADATHRAWAEGLATAFAELRDAAAHPTARPPTVTHAALLDRVPPVVR